MSDEAISIARRLPLSIEEWLTEEDPAGTWLPSRQTVIALRLNLIKADDMEGGFRLTDLGNEVRNILMQGAS